jgi:hypothetical protein
MALILRTTVTPPTMRIECLWPDTKWITVWSNIQAAPVSEHMKAQWYIITHDLLPTNERLQKIRLSTTDKCKHCNMTDTLNHRLIECGEGRSTWYWTRRRIAALLRIDERNIPEEWLLRPDFNLWPPNRHRAVLWILIHLAGYRMKRDRILTMNDFIDFVRRSKWKATNTTNWTSLTGNYLQILDE